MNVKASRRSFLKKTAAAGLISCLPTGTLLANAENQVHESEENEKNLVFVFQGDSITDGNRGRDNDPNHIMGHGYAFSIAGQVGADFPNAGFSFYNRGISGNKVADLQQRWQTDTLDLKPDVLSILVGINDVDQAIHDPQNAKSQEQFEQIYRSILDLCNQNNPKILFVLGLPFVYPVGYRKEKWEQWKEGTSIRAEIVRKLANEFNAVLVDFPSVFDKATKTSPIDYWIWDGIHPTVFGHELMAREWIKQVGSRLKFLKKYR